MNLSKSFGNALRGILHIAKMQDDSRNVQIAEIVGNLSVPKHLILVNINKR